MSLRVIATRCLPPRVSARPTEEDYARFRQGCRDELGITGTDAELDKLARTCLEVGARNRRRRNVKYT